MSQKQEEKQEREVKLFGKWSFKNIEVKDLGLQRYVSLKPVVIPHSMGRHEHKRFRKASISIVERLANNLMRPGKNAGKKAKVMNMVDHAFEIVNLRTGKNPVEVLIKAVENSAPCEDTTRISMGGIVYHQSVDIAPQRRVDLAIRHLADGARQAAVNNPRSIEECLAEELILAGNHDMKSFAVAKRHELERVAQASR
ncbi:MAG: 30S ribosomal protein S7 [Candidatus Bathyarchaeia archaeon]